MQNYYTVQTNFYGKSNPEELLVKYGSPLYVYNEAILRLRCREMAALASYPNFKVTYSIKANSNLRILQIVREEGLHADAMSPGEIYVLLEAGFKPEEIFYISNNASEDEMRFALEKGIMTSVDSVSQLKLFGRINPGGEVAIRLNPGIGAGHHEKVVTAGKKTKFGISLNYLDDVKKLLREYNLKLAGINQHIGSLFMEADSYLQSVRSVLSLAGQFDDIKFVDFGGGFGIPYHKQDGQERLELLEFGKKFSDILNNWAEKYGRKILFRTEPGRYIVAECGVLLGRVYAMKQNYNTTYAGTDLGFNVLARPVMYGSHHDIEVYKDGVPASAAEKQVVTVVGNICESGDIIAAGRELPRIDEGDILGVMDAGAYGYSMASNYNNRLRPAEVLIRQDGGHELIRRRDTFEDLMGNCRK
jgi:diaminopimelate decarboxylase